MATRRTCIIIILAMLLSLITGCKAIKNSEDVIYDNTVDSFESIEIDKTSYFLLTDLEIIRAYATNGDDSRFYCIGSFKDCNGNANYIRVILNSSSFDKLDVDECGYISVQKLSGKFTISSNWEDEEKFFYDYPDYGSLNNENDAEEFLELSSNPPELSGEHNKIYTIEFDTPLEK
ncbi:MAG: hypothetical protein K6D38_07735 [Pseudobutyrivibrio sp.]|nr:hypothetical protein [Pseudobutyrivibrio sp.]